MSEFVMLVGIPACGKSTLSNDYRAKGYEILSYEQIRLEMAGTENVYQLEKTALNQLNANVFEYIKKNATELLKNDKSVVIDATSLGRKNRKSHN